MDHHRRAITLVIAVVVMLGLTGCPTYSDIPEHQDVDDPTCINCHFVTGEGPAPPDDHWDGDTAATRHDACTHCHYPGG